LHPVSDLVAQLAGGIGHDINNQISVIAGYLEMARLERDGAGGDRLEKIQHGLRALEAMARRLVLLGRAHAVRPVELDVPAIAEAAAARALRAGRDEASFSLSVEPELGRVEAIPELLEACLAELILRAAGREVPASVRIDVGATFHDADFVRERPGARLGAHVRFRIRGGGISRGALASRRCLLDAATDASASSGAAWALAVAVVKQHRGWIDLEPEPGGASFVIDLPSRAPIAAASLPRSRRVVLVVEDEATVRDLAATVLRDHGIDVIAAASAEEALAAIDAAEASVSVLVTDVSLPSMDGITLAHRVRERCPEAKLIVTSGVGEEGLRDRLDGDASTVLLAKPYRLRQLVASVGGLLDDDASARRGR
jgi:two-component system cell cycle sensor histidine kinase/response regulator CckA